MANDRSSPAIFFTSASGRNTRHLSKKYPQLMKDLEPVIAALKRGELPGDKCGQATPTRGAANRVGHLQRSDRVILVTIYSKSDQGDISAKAIAALIKKQAPREEDQQRS